MKSIKVMLAALMSLFLALSITACGGSGGGDDSGSIPNVGTNATITGTVSGTTVIAFNQANTEITRNIASGVPKTFTLSIPLGATYKLYFVENEGTSNEKVSSLYQNSTNLFNITAAVTINLGYVDTSSGVAIPANNPLSIAGVTSAGEDKTIPQSIITVVNYFPLEVGNRWIYSSFVEGKFRNDEIIGSEVINGSTTYIKERIEPAPDNYHEKRFLAYDSSSVLMFRFWGNLVAEPELIDFSPPLIENKLSPQVGDQWSYGSPDFITVNSEVLSVNDTVTVPAGTFTNCIKILTTSTPSDKVHIYHYAPEVGVVRYELTGEWVEELVYAKIGAKTYGVAP